MHYTTLIHLTTLYYTTLYYTTSLCYTMLSCTTLHHTLVPTGLPSCGWDVAVYVFDINQLGLPTPLYSVLLSVSVFMALSNVFHPINFPDNSPLSHSVIHSVLSVLVLSTAYLFMKVTLSPGIILCG